LIRNEETLFTQPYESFVQIASFHIGQE